MQVAVVVFDGIFDSGLAATLDVLDNANGLGEQIHEAPTWDVTMVGAAPLVKTGAGLQVTPAPLERALEADLLVVPALAVLPYGRGGMIGAVMLGFGRAMGETIAVSLIISPAWAINWHVLHTGGMSVPSLIALRYTESTPQMLSALMAAGLVLFAFTLAVNALAGVIITRARSGGQTAD